MAILAGITLSENLTNNQP